MHYAATYERLLLKPSDFPYHAQLTFVHLFVSAMEWVLVWTIFASCSSILLIDSLTVPLAEVVLWYFW